MTSRTDGRGAGLRARVESRPSAARLLVAAAGAGAALAAVLGSGVSDVTGAVWLAAGRVCGTSPPSGLALVMPAAMVVVALAAGRAEGGAAWWRGAVLARLGPMAALHVAVMLGDDVSHRAGSVLLGRELRATILAGLVTALWVAQGIALPARAVCAARCALVMALLLFTAPLHWSLAAAAALLWAGVAVLPEGATRQRLPITCGFPAIGAVAFWG